MPRRGGAERGEIQIAPAQGPRRHPTEERYEDPRLDGTRRRCRRTGVVLVADSSDRDEAWEEFLEVWCDLRAAAAIPGTVVVVEGERDRAALSALYIRGDIVALHNGRPLAHVAHQIAERARTVVILTDWDTKGGQLARRFRVFLEAMPLTLDLDSRRRLSKAVRGEVAHVEGLAGWARRSADRVGTTVETALDEAELGRRRRRRPTG